MSLRRSVLSTSPAALVTDPSAFPGEQPSGQDYVLPERPGGCGHPIPARTARGSLLRACVPQRPLLGDAAWFQATSGVSSAVPQTPAPAPGAGLLRTCQTSAGKGTSSCHFIAAQYQSPDGTGTCFRYSFFFFLRA